MPELSPEAGKVRGSISRMWHDLQQGDACSFPKWPHGDMQWESAAWACHRYLLELQTSRKQLMLERWRASYRQKCDPHSVRSHRYVSGKCKYQSLRGLLVDGTFQVDAQAVDEALRGTWNGVHRLRNTDPLTVLRTFETKYAALVPSFDSSDWQPLCAADFVQALKHTKAHTAAGPCGWRASELKKLPVVAWEQMARIFNVAELQGQLPRLCQVLWQAAVPKTLEGQVDAASVRPIAVYSVVYRLYAKARYRSLRDDFARVVHRDQYGGIRGRQAVTPIFHIVSHLERAKRQQHGADAEPSEALPHWITYDLTKAFDTVLPQLACRALEIAGFSEPFVRTYLHHLTHNIRRWKLPHRGLGQQWHSNTGIAQGCPLSAMAAVSVYGIITRHVLKRAAEANATIQVLSFIDDFSVGAADLYSLDVARRAMDEVVADFGLTINVAKTKVQEQKVLGAIAGSGECLALAHRYWESKLQDVCQRVARVAHLPIAYWGKTKLLETNAMSSWRYVPLSCPLVWNQYSRIVRAVMAALGNGTTRSPAVAQEILFTTQVRLHVAHPGFAHLYTLCKLYRQHVASHPSDIIACWADGTSHGVCGSIRHLCAYLKLALSPIGMLSNRAGDSFSIADGEFGASWLHQLRHFFRRHELMALQTRRPREFDGVLQVDLDQVRKC
eukprot:878140-Amphidinium_carterae.1